MIINMNNLLFMMIIQKILLNLNNVLLNNKLIKFLIDTMKQL